jgi:1-acyl-sn-glycerol-3-phosphate acyltransferase
MVWKIINYLQAVFILLITFLSGASTIMLRALTGSPRYGFPVMQYFWSPLSLFLLGIRVRKIRHVTLDSNKAYIFYGNHSSWIDIAVVNRVIPRKLHFIAKSELKRKWFVGGAIRSMDMIFVDRGNREDAIKSLDEAARRIRSGKDIIAFPEGTRSRDGKMKPTFKKGIFHMAIKAQVEMIPIAISGAFELVPPGFKMRPGVVKVAMGDPISTQEMDASQVKELMEIAWHSLDKLKRESEL